MWISLCTIVMAVAICLSVAALTMWSNHPRRVNPRSITLLGKSQKASLGKLTAEQKVREYNRGQKAARDGRSRYWSEPSAYPFESDEHYQGRTEAFDQGYDDQFWDKLREVYRTDA